MCTYNRTLFNCNHYSWGSRVQTCPREDKHVAGKLDKPCHLRISYAVFTRKVAIKCVKCQENDKQLAIIKEKLAACKEIVSRMNERDQKWKEEHAKRKTLLGGEKERDSCLALEELLESSLTASQTLEDLQEVEEEEQTSEVAEEPTN